MKLRKIFSVTLLLLVIALIGNAQQSKSEEFPKIMSSDYTRNNQNLVIISTIYKFRDKIIILKEEYFDNENQLLERMKIKLSGLNSCSDGESLVGQNKKIAGYKYMCESSNGLNKVLYYSFKEKTYEVIAESDDLIFQFTGKISPIFCHLNPTRCVGVYYY